MSGRRGEGEEEGMWVKTKMETSDRDEEEELMKGWYEAQKK